MVREGWWWWRGGKGGVVVVTWWWSGGSDVVVMEEWWWRGDGMVVVTRWWWWWGGGEPEWKPHSSRVNIAPMRETVKYSPFSLPPFSSLAVSALSWDIHLRLFSSSPYLSALFKEERETRREKKLISSANHKREQSLREKKTGRSPRGQLNHLSHGDLLILLLCGATEQPR